MCSRRILSSDGKDAKMCKCLQGYIYTSLLKPPGCCFYEVDTPIAVHIKFRQGYKNTLEKNLKKTKNL